MKKIVVKFGGSVLKNPEDVTSLNRALSGYEHHVVVVVSAFYGVTDQLSQVLDIGKLSGRSIRNFIQTISRIHLHFAEKLIPDGREREETKREVLILSEKLKDHLTGLLLIGDIPPPSAAFILSFGERFSSCILSRVLKRRGRKLRLVTPEEAVIYAEGPVMNASFDLDRSGPSLRRSLSGKRDFIIPGFYGLTDMERISIFGRGGSDYTAAGIAACINAGSCDLWKDVDGFMTADPGLVIKASGIPVLSYGEAAELSYFGARITHPETFAPVRSKGIPLRIFNIQKPARDRDLPAASTLITNRSPGNPNVIKSVTGSADFAVLRVKGSGVGIHPGIISAISGKLNEKGINIRSIITSQTTINLLLSSADIMESHSMILELNIPDIEETGADGDIALIAAVGSGFRDRYGVAARILNILSENRINVKLITAGASDEAMYLAVGRNDLERGVKLIHGEFFEKERRR